MQYISIKFRINQRGSILFMTLLILTSMITAVLLSANLIMANIIMSGSQEMSTRAYYSSDAAIEKVLYKLRKEHGGVLFRRSYSPEVDCEMGDYLNLDVDPVACVADENSCGASGADSCIYYLLNGPDYSYSLRYAKDADDKKYYIAKGQYKSLLSRSIEVNFFENAIPIGGYCGDGACDAGECAYCALDCAVADCCGNLVCDIAIGENYSNCPGDSCAECGDGFCDVAAGECLLACANIDCNAGQCCGDEICELAIEDRNTCADDCANCGDTFCDPGECDAYCVADCTATDCCGDGTCDPTVPWAETADTCCNDCNCALTYVNTNCNLGTNPPFGQCQCNIGYIDCNIGDGEYNLCDCQPTTGDVCYSDSCIDTSDGLISWWKLDSDCADSKDGNPGTTCDVSSWPAGEVSQCGSFNGTTNVINMGDKANLNMGTSDWTVVVWIKTSNTVNQAAVTKVSAYSTYNIGWAVYFTKKVDQNWLILRSLIGVRNKGQVASTEDGFNMADGNWHHVAVVYDRDGYMTRYVDGVQYGSQNSIVAGNGDNIFYTNNAMIGNIGTGTMPFDGEIDEVRVYNRVLSQSEIQAIYNYEDSLP